MLSTYVLWFVVSFLFFDPWHMFTCFIQYLLMTPTYINILNVYAFCNTDDLTWGTKGADSAAGPGAKKKENGKFEVELNANPHAQYDHEIAKIERPASETPLEPPTEEEIEKARKDKQTAYYASVRSGIVMLWIFSNLALATVVLETGSMSALIDSVSKKGAELSQAEAQAKNASIYLGVVLWSVAALSAFRGVGAMWFLVHRKVSH